MKKLLIVLAVALSGCAAMDMTNDAKFNERVQNRNTDMMETNRLKNEPVRLE